MNPNPGCKRAGYGHPPVAVDKLVPEHSLPGGRFKFVNVKSWGLIVRFTYGQFNESGINSYECFH